MARTRSKSRQMKHVQAESKISIPPSKKRLVFFVPYHLFCFSFIERKRVPLCVSINYICESYAFFIYLIMYFINIHVANEMKLNDVYSTQTVCVRSI